jgi:UDP-N-acetylglucosamine acyltransferase
MFTDGNPAAVRGLNSVGLRRAGFDAATLRSLKEAYRILFEGHGPREEVIARLDGLSSAAARHIAEFLRASRRAFHRAA